MFYLLVLYFKGSITKCPFRIPVSIRAGRKDLRDGVATMLGVGGWPTDSTTGAALEDGVSGPWLQHFPTDPITKNHSVV